MPTPNIFTKLEPYPDRASFYAARGLEEVTALDVREDDVIFVYGGYRVRVSDVVQYTIHHRDRVEHVARYKLNSEPGHKHLSPLPPGFEGMSSGGNHLARVLRYITPPPRV